MQKCFYLICPTDFLEHTINRKFNYENYFYTSLGNSFIYDDKTIKNISKIIKKHKINEIYFVLSTDNKIVLDALKDKEFSNTRALNSFYNEITMQAKHYKISLQRHNRQFAAITYYLNKKIKELELQLTNSLDRSIKISGKIYNKEQDVFTTIYSNLVCLEKHHLN